MIREVELRLILVVETEKDVPEEFIEGKVGDVRRTIEQYECVGANVEYGGHKEYFRKEGER